MSRSFLDFARDVGELANAAGELSQQVPGVRAAVKGFCRVYGGLPTTAVLGALDIGTICTPYLAEDGRSLGGPGTPPFTGGQCPGVSYLVAWAVNGGAQSGNTIVQGPVVQGSTVQSNGRPAVTINGTGVASVAPGQAITFTTFEVTRQDGQADNCGDPEAGFDEGAGYDGETFGDPQNVTGTDGRDYEVVIDEPTVGPGGSLSIPFTVDGVSLNFGDSGSDDADPASPDYDSPGDSLEPGPDGGDDGADNPDDGIDSYQAAAAVTVVLTEEPPNASREVSTIENVFVAGVSSDAGWFRWKTPTGETTPQRLLGRTTTFIFSPGICAEADGFQVKFSPGFSGFAIPYVCATPSEVEAM
jgi:hypothetical protein